MSSTNNYPRYDASIMRTTHPQSPSSLSTSSRSTHYQGVPNEISMTVKLRPTYGTNVISSSSYHKAYLSGVGQSSGYTPLQSINAPILPPLPPPPPPSRLEVLSEWWRRNVVARYEEMIAAPWFPLQWSREQWYLFISVLALMIATAAERVTFKMAVDRMQPFRFMLIETIFIISAAFYCLITLVKQSTTRKITTQMTTFPHSKLRMMAILDTLHFSGLLVCASGVSPTMTVILLHTSTPFIVLGSRLTFPDRKYSEVQMRGVVLISLAMLISLSRPVIDIYQDKLDVKDATASILYAGAAALQGIATLYKEKCIIEWGRPLDIHYLSSWLFVYQFGVAMILAPLIYLLQGVSNDWGGFPLSSFFTNMSDGLECLWGNDPPPSPPTLYDSADTECHNSMWIILAFVVSNIIVLECIDRVLQLSNQILGRAMALAVLFAFLSLFVYASKESNDDDDAAAAAAAGNKRFNSNSHHSAGATNVGYADILSIIILLCGMEVYGRDPEPDVEVITNYI